MLVTVVMVLSILLVISFLHKDVLRFIVLGLSVLLESQYVV